MRASDFDQQNPASKYRQFFLIERFKEHQSMTGIHVDMDKSYPEHS